MVDCLLWRFWFDSMVCIMLTYFECLILMSFMICLLCLFVVAYCYFCALLEFVVLVSLTFVLLACGRCCFDLVLIVVL